MSHSLLLSFFSELFKMVLKSIIPIFAKLIVEPLQIYVLSPVVRHVSYPFRCNSNVKNLQHKVELLKNKRLRLQQSANVATRNGEEIFPDVNKWLTSASKDIEDADKLIEERAEAMNKCFVGLCPNLKTRYQLSKKAHKKALAVGKQLQNAEAVPDPISFRPPPQPIPEPSLYSSEALPSRVMILKQIMDALKDRNFNMIGVYGMGGVGKTTLAKEVQGKAIQEKNFFETVVMVAISKTPDLRRIQGEIADMLGLKFDAEGVPGRASQLYKRLEKAKVLIILDDVWQRLDLKVVGVPHGDAYEGCKIFLTSRSKDVLCNEMRTQKEFSLEVLGKDETWRLFEKSVSNIADQELHRIATDIANKCAGLPLLILKVAAELRGKQTHAWKDMSKRLSNLENTEIYEKVHKVIESSYENLLDPEAKSLFLLCALFGDSNLEIQKLLMYSVGLELFKRIDSIEEARNRVLTLVDKLKDDCLLLDGDRAGFVKIHDVVLDVALVLASREQHVFVGAGKVRSQDFQNKDFTRVSLPFCDILEFPGRLKCPKAEVFSLFADDHLNTPSSFFIGVPKLKVVDISGVRFASRLPFSLVCLTGLQTLCLQGCEFDNVAVVAGLKQLECLSFSRSKIEEFPVEMKGLIRLKLLDLGGCSQLQVIPENVLSNLYSLEELYMFDSFSRWETEGNASLEELKNLSHLTTLEIRIESDKLLPDDWFFNGVQNYRIEIGEYWFPQRCLYVKSTSRRILKLQLESRKTGLMHKIKEFVRGTEVLELRKVKGVENLLYDFGMENTDSDSFGKLRILEIHCCDTLKSLFSHSFAKYLPQLQEVEVGSCGNMEAIVGEGCGDEVIEFTHLTSLELSSLPNLISICKTSGMVSFPKLTTLVIKGCNGLKYVFTNSMVKSLEQLKELKIEWCDSLKDIILSEEKEEVSINRMVFTKCLPQLEELDVESYENMEAIAGEGCGDEVIGFTQLTSLTIIHLPKLISICKTSGMVSFPKLTTLMIRWCHRLKYVFTNSMVKSLEQLKVVKIDSCDLLKDIILSEETKEASINRMAFPKLNILKLKHLQELKRFSSGHHIDFPSLRVLKIKRCGAIKNLVPKFINRSNNNESVDEYIFNEMVSFQKLEHLSIEGIDLKYVFHEWVACGLLQLRELEIRRCGVEMIFGNEEEETIEIECPNLKHMTVLDCPYLIKLGSNNSKVSFTSLTTLDIKGCNGLEYIFTSSMACGLLQLRELKIGNCGVEVIIGNVEEETIEIKWPTLTHLEVLSCENLIKFGSNISMLFPKVEVLELDDHSFKAIKNDGLPVDFPLEMKRVLLMGLSVNGSTSDSLFGFLRRINSLERLIFDNCCLELDCILSLDDGQEIHLTLEHLELSGVSNLKHILKKESQLNPLLQHLQSLLVCGCLHLMNIAPSSASFQNLTTLEVKYCKNMTSLVTASTAKTMVQLKELRVSDCKMMEEIVSRDDMVGCTENDGITFKNLKLLKLISLDRLSSFCSGNYQFNFPLLEDVTVRSCPRMMSFCSGILNTPKLHQIIINYEGKQWEGDLNATIRRHLIEWVGEPILPNKMQLFTGLKELIVRDCNWVEVVFDLEGGNIGLLPELRQLELINLPKLTQLCNRDPRGILDFNNLRMLEIENCSRLEYALTTSMSRCLSQLLKIEVNNCEMMKTIIMEEDATDNLERSDLEYCPSLQYLTIGNCPSIKAFISRRTMNDLDIHLSSEAFSNFQELVLDITSIKAILKYELPTNLFSKAKKLELGHGSSSGTKFLVRLLHLLSMEFNIKQLKVCNSSVKELFKFQGLNLKKEVTTTLPQIRELKLYNLAYLKQIWWQNSELKVPIFQSLEVLQVKFCGQIISVASSATSFRNLKKLEVDGCNQLRYMVTSSVARSMVQLVTLRVKSCEMLTEIVGDGDDGTNNDIIFPKLKTLVLFKLQSLTSFSSGHLAFQFPCLREVFVQKCPSLKFFCHGIVIAPMLRSVNDPDLESGRDTDSDSGDYYWEGDLNTTIEDMYKNLLVGFQNVKDVKLSMFPVLKEKWAAQFPFKRLGLLRRLEVDDCAEFTSAISSHLLPHLSNLEVLMVKKCDSVEQVFDQRKAFLTLEYLNELQLIDLPSLRNVWRKDPHQRSSFKNLQELTVQNCGKLTSIFNLTLALSLPNLRYLEVINCSLVECIIAEEEDETMQKYQTIFPTLRKIRLENLAKLSSFCSTSGLLECPFLKSIEVFGCPNMELSSSTFSKVQGSFSMTSEEREQKIGTQYGDSVVPLLGNSIVIPNLEELRVEWNILTDYLNDDNNQFFSRLRFIDITGFKDEYAIFPSNLLQNFPNLEKLTLSDSSMEEMNLDELSIFNNSVDLSIKLELSNMPKLKHLVRDDSQLVPLFQILVKLKLCECNRLEFLVPSSVPFQNLAALVVSKCDGMKNLISASTARSLVQLKRMKVRDCKMMQEIVAVISNEVDEIRFSQIEYLELEDLPCLTSFYSGNSVLHFPSLEEVMVEKCPNMMTFAQKVEITQKLKRVETGRREYEWEWEGSLNNTIHSLYMDKDD